MNDLCTRPAFHAPGRPYMSMEGRAAQFAAYKSLVGYEEMIGDAEAEEMRADEREIITELDYLESEN